MIHWDRPTLALCPEELRTFTIKIHEDASLTQAENLNAAIEAVIRLRRDLDAAKRTIAQLQAKKTKRSLWGDRGWGFFRDKENA